jgi:hypothetical protein
MKDGSRKALKIDDAVNPGDDKDASLQLPKPADRRQAERRSDGKRRYSHSAGAYKPEKRSLLDRRGAKRRMSDTEMGDKK